MFQIDGPDVVAEKPAKKPAVNPGGWFDGGDPLSNQSATMVTRDWLNTVQAELKNVIEAANISLDRQNDSQLLAAILALATTTAANIVNNAAPPPSSIPVGLGGWWLGATAPEGWFLCNGQSFSASSYPQLYAFLGKSTMPDMRGAFLRMLGGQSASLGVVQQDAGRNITGTLKFARNPAIREERNGALEFVRGAYNGANGLTNASSAGRFESYAYLDASWVWGATHVANEFRPTNVAVNYIMKHD